MQLMRHRAAAVSAAIILFCCSSTVLAAGNVSVVKAPAPQPARIGAKLMVVGAELLRDQWPGTLPLVNVPASRSMALPGQCISVAVMAHGDDRDALLTQTTYSFEIEFDGQKQKFEGVHPAVIKRIKPGGGDFVMQVLGAAQADVGKLPDMSSASVAAFDLNWCVPKGARDGTATISGSAVLPKGAALHFEKTSLPVVSFDKGVKEGTFKNKDEFGAWFMTYYRQPNPARVLAACRILADDNLAFSLNIRVFLVEVLRSSPEAARALQERLAGEDSAVRGYALHLLQNAGYDIAPLMARLPEKDRAFQQEFLRRVPPLVDPYDLRIDPAHFDTAARMDGLWSIFLATGKPKPVRAVADLLLWRGDYPAIREAMKTPEKHKQLTAALGRGVCYMTAGWSLRSFVRNDTLVADFVDAWKADPATPKVLKEELNNLFVNDAFTRKK